MYRDKKHVETEIWQVIQAGAIQSQSQTAKPVNKKPHRLKTLNGNKNKHRQQMKIEKKINFLSECCQDELK